MFNNMKLKWKLTSGFSLPLILLIIIAATVNQSLSKLLEIQGWVTHTHEVIKTGTDITSSLVNMETGLRGYLVTGKEEFLDPYKEGKQQFHKLIDYGRQQVSDNPEQVERLTKVERVKQDWINNHVDIAMNLRNNVNQGKASLSEVSAFTEKAIGKTYMDKMRVHLNEFIAAEDVLIGVRAAEQQSTADTTSNITTMGTIIALILGGIASILIIRNLGQLIGGEPTYAIEVSTRIADGNLEAPVEVNEKDTHSLLHAMKVMRENLLTRAQSDQKLAAETSRIKSALDVCDTNVMVADADFDIIYMNDAVQNMMRVAEADLKQEIPRFDANKLLGSNIDVFHKNPAHQRDLLDNLKDTYKTQITVSSRTFGLVATPIYNANNTRLGTVVEWDDMTERLAKEVADKQIADENAGIKLALDVCDTNVMMADTEFNINYMNAAVQA